MVGYVETLYKKKGRKYIPVGEYDSLVMDALPEGFTLIYCKPGSKSYRYLISPDCIQLIAAARVMEDAMLEAMQEASKFRPNKPLTLKQKAAYDKFAKEMGSDLYLLQSKSAWDVVQAGIQVLIDYEKGSEDGCSSTTGS